MQILQVPEPLGWAWLVGSRVWARAYQPAAPFGTVKERLVRPWYAYARGGICQHPGILDADEVELQWRATIVFATPFLVLQLALNGKA